MSNDRCSTILSPYECLTKEDLVYLIILLIFRVQIAANENITKRKKKSRNYRLLLPLNQECLSIAQALYCMNIIMQLSYII